MKKVLFFVFVLFMINTVVAQQIYQVLTERPNEKSYKGTISREVLEADTTFKWFAANYKSHTPNADAVAGLKKHADSLQLLVFMGTWCEDSQFIIPKMYALLDAAAFSANRITLIGVDRNKTTFSNLTNALNIKNVPTIMVMKNGKELGRVVEYGKYGVFDKELAEVINTADKN
jgi:thiol-disulfide isomerase/thioredoxin